MMPRIAKVTALTAVLLLAWSAFFAPTFRFPFYWDDFHLIRSYTGPEISSTFHDVIDPDKIETPGLRPCSIFLYNFQGTAFGENVVAHRVFVVALMGIFMIAAGMLLLELGLSFVQLAIVLALLVSSRVFASLALWICLSHLVMAYIWIVLTAYSFVLWAKRGRWFFFLFTLVFATLATFTREETYTLPVVLPLLWLISSFDPRQFRRVAAAALSIFTIVCFHYWLWHFLVSNALSPDFKLSAIKGLLVAMAASWLPGGFTWRGPTDIFIALTWIAFLIVVVLLFIPLAKPRARWQLFGVCCLGALLSLPALGAARSFGIALPTLAFMSAVSVAIGEIYSQVKSEPQFRNWQRYATLGIIIVGLATGIVGGINRSRYVAESMYENAATRMVRDGKFLFEMFNQPATIPDSRRQAGLDRLKAFGIRSADDVRSLEKALKANPKQYRQPSATSNGLLLPKYDYLTF
jgi:hypothetical protein